MDVSIVLVNYNTKDLTLECLNSVYEKTSDLNFEIFVVDNASIDGSCQAIKELFPEVKLIENSENLGFGKANNIGIKQSQGKYVFLLNTDTLLINNAIKILFDFMEANKSVGACGGNLFDKGMNMVHSHGYLNSPMRHLGRLSGIRYFKNKLKNDANRDKLQEAELIIGADLMIRKSILDEIGTFDERFFLYYEDSELQFRIRKFGHKIFYVPDAKIIHYENASSKNNKKNRRQIITESEYLYFSICYGHYPKIFLRLLCTIPYLYRVFNAPKNVYSALKYIWTN